MPDKEPVLIYILGPEIEVPSYNQLVETKIACEKAGQPFILIPEPKIDASGNYLKDNQDEYIPSTVNLSINYIRKTIEPYFENDGQYAGMDFTLCLNTHGDIQSKDHVSQLVDNENLENRYRLAKTTNILDVFNKIRDDDGANLWRGVFDLSCHSGGSVIDVAQSINKNPIQNDLSFLSSAGFSNVAHGHGFFVTELVAMAEAGTAFTTENLKTAYLKVFSADTNEFAYPDPNITERVFKAGEQLDLTSLAYENLEGKLQYIFDNYETFHLNYGSNEKFNELLTAIQEHAERGESTLSLKRDLSFANNDELQNLDYPDILGIADALYDDYAQKIQGLDVNNSEISTTLLRLYDEDFRSLRKLSTEDRHEKLMELTNSGKASLGKGSSGLEKNPISVIIEHSNQWGRFVSEDQKTEILTLAWSRALSWSSTQILNNHQALEESLGTKTAGNFIKEAARNSVKSSWTDRVYLFSSNNGEWLQLLEKEDAENIMAAAFSKNWPDVLESYSRWKDNIPEDSRQKIIDNFAGNLDANNKDVFLTQYIIFEEALGEERAKALAQDALQQLGISIKGLPNYESFSLLLEQAYNDVLARMPTDFSSRALADSYPRWKGHLSTEQRTELLTQTLGSTANNALIYHDLLKENMAEESFNLLLSAALEQAPPTLILSTYDKWSGDVDETKRRTLLDDAIATVTASTMSSRTIRQVGEMLAGIEDPALAKEAYTKLQNAIEAAGQDSKNILPELKIGGLSNDYLTSGSGRESILIGSNGNDTLIGGDGDTLRGGLGSDDFIVTQGTGQRTIIADFNPKEDQFYLTKEGVQHDIKNAKRALSNAKVSHVRFDRQGDNLQIRLKRSGQSITFEGISEADAEEVKATLDQLGINLETISDEKLSPPVQTLKNTLSQDGRPR